MATPPQTQPDPQSQPPTQPQSEAMMDVFSPNDATTGAPGIKGKIPFSQWPDAAKNGYKAAVRVTDQGGNGGWVPSDQAGTAIKDHGYRLGPPSQQPGIPILEGYQKTGSALKSWASDTSKALYNLIKPPETTGEKASMLLGPSGPMMTRIIGGTAGAMRKSMQQSQQYGSQIKYATDEKGNPQFDADGNMALAGSTPDELAQNVTNDMRSKVSAISALNPFAAPVVSEVNELKDQGKPEEAAVRGIANAVLLGTGEELNAGIGKTLKTAAKIPGATKAAFTPTAAQRLGTVIKPGDVGAFQTAAADVMPIIQRAAQSRGVQQMTIDSVLDSIGQAKEDVLKQHESTVGHLGELPQDQAATLNQRMDQLDTIRRELQAARDKAATPPKQNGAAGKLQIFNSTKPRTLADLNAGIQDAFDRSRPAPGTLDTAAQPPPQTPYQGDTSVKHDSAIFPPETPHGDATVLPDVPNPRFQLSSSSTAQLPQSLLRRSSAPVRKPVIPAPVAADNGIGSSTAFPQGVIPQREPVQPSLAASVPAQTVSDNVTAARKPASVSAPQSGDIFPNDKAMEDWLDQQEQSNPALQRIKDLAKERIRQGDLPPGIRPSDAELSRMNGQIHSMIYEANAQGVDTPAHLDRIDQWIRATDKQPKPFQPGQPLKTRPAPTQTSMESRPQGYQGPERRQDLDFRSAFDEMSPEDQVKTAFFSEKTGLPNYRAFQKSESFLKDSHPHVGYADVDDFKAANTVLGKEAVDTKILPMFGDLFKEAAADEPGVHVFHRSGDEFLFRADDPAAVTRVVNRVNQKMQGAKFTVERADGSIVEHTGTGLSHGTGATEDAAELAAEQDKQQRTAAGDRTGARDINKSTAQSDTKDAAPVQPLASSDTGGQQATLGDSSGRQEILGVNVRKGNGTAGTVPAADLQRGDTAYVNPQELKLAPKTFQYKQNVNEKGVTNSLSDAGWNEELGGIVHAFKNPETGELNPVNGHHRTELAQRSNANRMLVHVMDETNPVMARSRGALMNLADGKGTAYDAGLFLRDSQLNPSDLQKMGISLSGATVRDGLALSRLHPSIMEKVGNGQLSESRGAAIGSTTSDPAQQEAIVQAITKAENRGKTLTDGQVDALSRRVVASSSRVEQGQDLFGAFEKEHSNYADEADLDDYVARQFASKQRTFGAVSTENKAATLSSVEGQSIKAKENAAMSQAAARKLELYKKLSTRAGPVDDIIRKVAAERANGYSNLTDARAKAFKMVDAELEQQMPPVQ